MSKVKIWVGPQHDRTDAWVGVSMAGHLLRVSTIRDNLHITRVAFSLGQVYGDQGRHISARSQQATCMAAQRHRVRTFLHFTLQYGFSTLCLKIFS